MIVKVIATIISEEAMSWKKPTITEIAVGTEINSYACASVKK